MASKSPRRRPSRPKVTPEEKKQKARAYAKKLKTAYEERVYGLARGLGKDPTRCLRCDKPKRGKGSLHWHHRNPAEKSFNIGAKNLSESMKRTDEELLAELGKCDRLCKPCHHYHHSVAGSGSIRPANPGYGADTWGVSMNFRSKENAEHARLILQMCRVEWGEV